MIYSGIASNQLRIEENKATQVLRSGFTRLNTARATALPRLLPPRVPLLPDCTPSCAHLAISHLLTAQSVLTVIICVWGRSHRADGTGARGTKLVILLRW
jgi:hypothetical protein